MQQCPNCDRVYDESEYSKCPYCHPEKKKVKKTKPKTTTNNLFAKIISHREGEIKANGKKYVSETKYESGMVERVRFTKYREVHDFDGPAGKRSIWSYKNNNLYDK